MSALSRIVRNSTINMAAVAVSALLNLVSMLYLARVLGPDALGRYYTFFVLTAVVQVTFEAGAATLLTYRLTRDPERWRETIAEAGGLLVLLGSVSALAVIAVGPFLDAADAAEPAWVLFGAAGVACVALQVQFFTAGVFRAFERFEYESLARVLQAGLFVGLVMLLVRHGPGALTMAVALFALSHLTAALYLVVILHRGWHCLGIRLSRAILGDWLAHSVPLGLGDGFRRLTLEIDSILLAALQPKAVLGIYSVALRPLGPVMLFSRVILTAMFPSLTRTAAQGPAAMGAPLAQCIRYLWIFNLPIAVGILLYAEPIIRVLAGKDYLEAAYPLRLLVGISLIVFLSLPFRFIFTALGRQHLFSVLAVTAFAIEATVEAVLIPAYSYVGACAGTFVGELFFLVAGLCVCRWLGMRGIEWSRLAVAAVAAVAMAAVLWPTRDWPLPLIVVVGVAGTGLFFGLCVLIGALTREEVRRLFGALRGGLRSA